MSIDPEIADDLINSFDEHYDELQNALNKLSHHPDDSELINLIFRSMHTVKGNASMVQIQPLVDFAHGMEETIDAMRNGNFPPSAQLCDLLLTGTDRLRDLHRHHLFGKAYEDFNEQAVETGFKQLATATSSTQAAEFANTLYQTLYPKLQEPEPDIDASQSSITHDILSEHASYLECSEQQQTDLDFFRELALQTDEKNDFWDGRTDRLMYMGMKLAALSTEVSIDSTQLAAAIYLHDIGMSFLPDTLVNKQAKLNPMEFKKLQQHVIWGHQWVSRLDGWEEAATMVLQHHEQDDGSGYPSGLDREATCEGAKILAIIDAFYAMTNLRSDRSHRRSILRAISEINACCGTQFNAYWVELFNQLVRAEVKKGTL